MTPSIGRIVIVYGHLVQSTQSIEDPAIVNSVELNAVVTDGVTSRRPMTEAELKAEDIVLKPGETRYVDDVVVGPVDTRINATMFPENASVPARYVRGVPFFQTKAEALAFRGPDPGKAPASEPDKYLVAYWPERVEEPRKAVSR